MAKTVLTVISVFIGITFWPRPLERGERAQMIVWYVGQGQWITSVDETMCVHIDVGGEFSALQAVQSLCARKRNVFAISHWDEDHLSFNRAALRTLPTSCLFNLPPGPTSPRKFKALKRWPLCHLESKLVLVDRPKENPNRKMAANDLSQVFMLRDWLLPGDSPRAREKLWASKKWQIEKSRHLVLGHHGSRTSTSDFLLRSLPHLQQAVVSARLRRYGHPHAETLSRLMRIGVPVLRTEDWGHLRFQN